MISNKNLKNPGLVKSLRSKTKEMLFYSCLRSFLRPRSLITKTTSEMLTPLLFPSHCFLAYQLIQQLLTRHWQRLLNTHHKKIEARLSTWKQMELSTDQKLSQLISLGQQKDQFPHMWTLKLNKFTLLFMIFEVPPSYKPVLESGRLVLSVLF